MPSHWSLQVWHARQVWRGEEKFRQYETLARSRVLNSLAVLTKSACQLLLQLAVVMLTWTEDSSLWHAARLLSVGFNILSLAASSTDHHYFESSGKDVAG